MSQNKHAELTEGREDDPIISSDPDSSEEDWEDASHPDGESSRNTTDEITDGQRMKSKKTLKRKRRATEPSHFGATLQSLLDTEAPSGHPLSLRPSLAHRRIDAKLELEAKRAIRAERKETEKRGRIRDVIGGWGGESERSLRKVAQRGVVKLFNTIQQSQLAAATAEKEARASRGTGKPSLPTPSLSRKDKGTKDRHKTKISSAEKQTAADKETFFDMIRSGGVVSKV